MDSARLWARDTCRWSQRPLKGGGTESTASVVAFDNQLPASHFSAARLTWLPQLLPDVVIKQPLKVASRRCWPGTLQAGSRLIMHLSNDFVPGAAMSGKCSSAHAEFNISHEAGPDATDFKVTGVRQAKINTQSSMGVAKLSTRWLPAHIDP